MRGHSDWDILCAMGFEPIEPPLGDPEDDLLYVSTAHEEAPVIYRVHISDAEETLPDGRTRDTTKTGARYTLWRDGIFVEIYDDYGDVLHLIQEETGYTADQMSFNAEMTAADAKRAEAEAGEGGPDPENAP